MNPSSCTCRDRFRGSKCCISERDFSDKRNSKVPVISFFFGNWAHKIVVSRLGRLRADLQSMCLMC